MSLASWWFNRIISSEDDEVSKYVLQASFDGRLKFDEDTSSTTGDLATLTASASKDLYVTAAKITFYTNNTGTNISVAGNEAVLKINGTVVETSKHSLHNNNTTNGKAIQSYDYEFKNMFHKVTATQAIKIEVISIDAHTDVEGFVQAIEVPAGENPTTYEGS